MKIFRIEFKSKSMLYYLLLLLDVNLSICFGYSAFKSYSQDQNKCFINMFICGVKLTLCLLEISFMYGDKFLIWLELCWKMSFMVNIFTVALGFATSSLIVNDFFIINFVIILIVKLLVNFFVKFNTQNRMKLKKLNSESINECSICLDQFGIEDCFELVCGHFFHKNCIENWFQQKNSCPLCRAEV